MSIVTAGNKVSVHYRGTLNDGTEFDSSHARGEPLDFQVGNGQLIRGFDEAVVGMSVGETKNITLTPIEAYGEINEKAFTDFPKTMFPEDFNIIEGALVPLSTVEGEKMIGTIAEIKEDGVTINLNHPMAGKDLNFEIELLEILAS